MDEIEVSKLLGLMALADNRKPPEDDEGRQAMITFWLGMVGDLPYADAAQAVRDHYRESREWMMPAHVRQRVKAMRAERIARTPLPAPPPDLADQPARYQRAIQAGVKRIADGMDPRKAIGGAPLDGEPPAAWQEAREAMAKPETAKPDPRDVALEQVAESRRERNGAAGERQAS